MRGLSGGSHRWAGGIKPLPPINEVASGAGPAAQQSIVPEFPGGGGGRVHTAPLPSSGRGRGASILDGAGQLAHSVAGIVRGSKRRDLMERLPGLVESGDAKSLLATALEASDLGASGLASMLFKEYGGARESLARSNQREADMHSRRKMAELLFPDDDGAQSKAQILASDPDQFDNFVRDRLKPPASATASDFVTVYDPNKPGAVRTVPVGSPRFTALIDKGWVKGSPPSENSGDNLMPVFDKEVGAVTYATGAEVRANRGRYGPVSAAPDGGSFRTLDEPLPDGRWQRKITYDGGQTWEPVGSPYERGAGVDFLDALVQQAARRALGGSGDPGATVPAAGAGGAPASPATVPAAAPPDGGAPAPAGAPPAGSAPTSNRGGRGSGYGGGSGVPVAVPGPGADPLAGVDATTRQSLQNAASEVNERSADPDAVRAKLRANGIDPALLDPLIRRQ